MFDTVLIGARVLDPPRVASRLEQAGAVSGYRREGDVFGRIGPLRVRQNGDLFKLEGSLTRYIGAAASASAVAGARAQLEEIIGEDLGDAAVWRLDVFADVAVTRPPADYCALLLDCPHLDRVQVTRGSIRFECGRRVLAFYDKGAERRTRGKPAPPGDVLRYELRYLREIKDQLKRGVCFSDLSDGGFRSWIAGKWETAYRSVRKGRAAMPITARLHDVRSWDRAVYLSGLKSEGEAAALGALQRGYEAGLMARSTYHERKQRALRLMADERHTAEHDAVRELDERVSEAADRMRGGVLS